MPGNIDYDNKPELSWLLNMFDWNCLFFSDVLCVVFFNSISFGSASLLILTLQLIHSRCCLFFSLCFFVLTVKVLANCYPSISITAAPPTAPGPDTFGPPWIHHLCLSIHLSMFPCFPSPFPPNSAFAPWLGFCSHGFCICIHRCYLSSFCTYTWYACTPSRAHKKRDLTKENNRSK